VTRLEALLASGELVALAKTVTTRPALAAAIGMSDGAYSGHVRRIRAAGRPFPSFDDLKRAAQGFADSDAVIRKSDNRIGPSIPNEGTGVPILGTAGPRTIDDDIADRKQRAEVSSLKSRLKDAIDQLEQCRYELGVAQGIGDARHDVPPIRPRETRSGLREATAVALASDWHIEEVVEGAKVNGVNEYNLDIAHRRAERYFAGLAYLIRYHQDHFAIRDLVLWLGGDLITGYLREEDLESNDVSPVQAIATLEVWLAEGIRSVLAGTDIELLTVVCNSGNHGRLTKKTQPRTREANSIEWLLYTWLAREFANEPRVKFVLPHGSQTYLDVYDWTIRFTHGDETKFGGGVGGIMIPIRKAIAKWQTVRRADVTVMGHYHQEHFLRDLVVNGSLVGFNEYALSIAAPYEDPRQGFFLMDKHRGITFPATIWVADRDGKRAA
jgi:hypothetical protein